MCYPSVECLQPSAALGRYLWHSSFDSRILVWRLLVILVSCVEVPVLIYLSGLIDQAGAKDENISSTLPEALQIYKDELSSARGAIVTESNHIVALILEIAKVN